jgi:hypothetical protein
MKSYSAYAGVQDAMVQWWYGHNAVGFFLTAGFLGMMYYFIPKQAERPVYSYRLSIVHFWALIFTYTALPDWTQSLGMVFSLILLAPSWGGMINGVMTLSGAWHKLRDDPVLRFLIVSLSFYGMSTFEGPMMSIKTVNALSHYTDWTVGHVHSGALGWVGLVTMGTMYYLIPRLFGQKKMYSVKAIEAHFSHVDCRCHARFDVARCQCRRHLDLHLCRVCESHIPLLCCAFFGWPVVFDRHVDHVVEHLENSYQRACRRGEHSSTCACARLSTIGETFNVKQFKNGWRFVPREN